MATLKQDKRDFTARYFGEILLSSTVWAFILLTMFNRIIYIQSTLTESTFASFYRGLGVDITNNFWSFYIWFIIIFALWVSYKGWQIRNDIKRASETNELLQKQNEKIDKLCEQIASLVDVMKKEKSDELQTNNQKRT